MPRYVDTPTVSSVQEAGVKFGYPLMLKAKRMAYDGKGNAAVMDEVNNIVGAIYVIRKPSSDILQSTDDCAVARLRPVCKRSATRMKIIPRMLPFLCMYTYMLVIRSTPSLSRNPSVISRDPTVYGVRYFLHLGILKSHSSYPNLG